MTVLGMGYLEILIVLLVAFIFLGPERMVDAARLLGKAVREVRNIAADLPNLDLEEQLFEPEEAPGRRQARAAARSRTSSPPRLTLKTTRAGSQGTLRWRSNRRGRRLPSARPRSRRKRQRERQAPHHHPAPAGAAAADDVVGRRGAGPHRGGLRVPSADPPAADGPAEGFAGIPNQKPIYTELTEFIGISMKVSLLTGLLASMPFILFQVVMFVAPGLTPGERRYLYALLPVSVLAFIAGAAFGYRILFPPAVRFLLGFGGDVADAYIRIGSYANLMLTLLFWMGVVFEMPVVLFFLSRMGVVDSAFLARQRRFAIVIAFVLGAIITPTFDPVNQALVAVPIILLYEVSIWLTKLGSRHRRARAQDLELDA